MNYNELLLYCRGKKDYFRSDKCHEVLLSLNENRIKDYFSVILNVDYVRAKESLGKIQVFLDCGNIIQFYFIDESSISGTIHKVSAHVTNKHYSEGNKIYPYFSNFMLTSIS